MLHLQFCIFVGATFAVLSVPICALRCFVTDVYGNDRAETCIKGDDRRCAHLVLSIDGQDFSVRSCYPGEKRFTPSEPSLFSAVTCNSYIIWDMYQYGNGFKGYNDLAGSDFARTIDTVMEAQRPPTVKKRDCCYGDLCNGDGLASSTDDNQCRTFDFLNPFFEDDDQPTHCKSDQTKCLTIVGQKRDTLESIPYQMCWPTDLDCSAKEFFNRHRVLLKDEQNPKDPSDRSYMKRELFEKKIQEYKWSQPTCCSEKLCNEDSKPDYNMHNNLAQHNDPGTNVDELGGGPGTNPDGPGSSAQTRYTTLLVIFAALVVHQ